jgi:MerR family transcriptional regulator/heat shock protein HspR
MRYILHYTEPGDVLLDGFAGTGMAGVAAQLCGIHPQTLRQYERLGLVSPQRAGAKNRLYSENDIRRVKRIQRLTQEMGVNLAGVELILRLLEDME